MTKRKGENISTVGDHLPCGMTRQYTSLRNVEVKVIHGVYLLQILRRHTLNPSGNCPVFHITIIQVRYFNLQFAIGTNSCSTVTSCSNPIFNWTVSHSTHVTLHCVCATADYLSFSYLFTDRHCSTTNNDYAIQLPIQFYSNNVITKIFNIVHLECDM